MTLPFEPQPLSVLRARLVDALAAPVDVLRVLAGYDVDPGLQRQHVLDCEDGLRLIVSVDRLPDDTVQVHLSASIHYPSPVWDTMARYPLRARQRFVAQAEQRWRDLGGSPLTFASFSPGKGVPHWVGPWEGPTSWPNIRC